MRKVFLLFVIVFFSSIAFGQSSLVQKAETVFLSGDGDFLLTFENAPVEGNMIIAIMGGRAGSATTIAPAEPDGWTALDHAIDQGRLWAFYKIAGPNEPMAHKFNHANSRYYGTLMEFSGVNFVSQTLVKTSGSAEEFSVGPIDALEGHIAIAAFAGRELEDYESVNWEAPFEVINRQQAKDAFAVSGSIAQYNVTENGPVSAKATWTGNAQPSGILFLLMAEEPPILIADEVIDYLVITEYRGNSPANAYIELTNMGNKPVQLNNFKLGHWGVNHTLNYETGQTGANSVGHWIPVDTLLQPGKSFLIATNWQHQVDAWEQFLPGSEKIVADNIRGKAGLLVFVTDPLNAVFTQQHGGNGIYLRQMLRNENGVYVDSLVVDQVGGTFTLAGGLNPDRIHPESHYPVAGVAGAIRNARLIRKANITKGNLDFNTARGIGLEDSEWIAIPFVGGAWRLAPWTIATHGHHTLNANTLVSDQIDIDFANKKLTVPWGVGRGDDIMNYFEEKPNIVWIYEMGGNADSLAHAAQTGDKLHIHVVGNSLQSAVFDIVVAEPTADANMLVSRSSWEHPGGGWRNEIPSGLWDWPRITKHDSGNDTIWGARGGIPYATRLDSLLAHLDKPGNADWKIVYASGVAKPDISHGDKILVTAQDGAEKEYFITVNPVFPSSNANLSTIHWPDIPEFYRGIFGWRGDTIPGFAPTILSYNIEIPLMVEGIPAFVAKPSHLNAKVEVDRAKNLTGSREDRTYKFTVTAEDEITKNIYSVILRKEQDFQNVQPNYADPFISERVFNWHWGGTGFVELFNPGNQLLDLSGYMIVSGWDPNPANTIEVTYNSWLARYNKYIPGYKWTASEGEWAVQQYIAERDLSVDALVYPGETFSMGWVNRGECALMDWYPGYHVNVQFKNTNLDAELECNRFVNHWGEEISTSFINMYHTSTLFLFKILNDSIQLGLKPAMDPNDFELIDVIGKADGSLWTIGLTGLDQPFSVRRKPHIYQGNPLPGAVLGENLEDSEVGLFNIPYFRSLGYGWRAEMLNILDDVGVHFMDAPTHYMSTVASQSYKVSEGYVSPQEIRGVKADETVSQFLANIIKMHEDQSLIVTSHADGFELADDALLNLNDTLTVVSADGVNTTKYVLEVSVEGLSSDAGLSSAIYDVSIDVQPSVSDGTPVAGSGTVSGFDYETLLKTLVNGLTPAQGATMNVIDARHGGYASFRLANFDTIYVDVTVNPHMYVEVMAEDGITVINYSIQPEASDSDAFVVSYVYGIVQSDFLIQFVPRGTSASAFLSHLIPSSGATIKVIDKWGFERTGGNVTDDDKLVVTSADGTVQNVYHIAMLPTETITGVFYLAYILSDVYGIDQVDHMINKVIIVDVADFLANIRPVAGATVVVVDKNGVVKTSGDIEKSDLVIVTSLDGRIEVVYTFGTLIDTTGTESIDLQVSQIEFFPNPTRGDLNVLGVEPGQRISVYSFTGRSVLEIDVRSNVQAIPLHNLSAGIYVIVVSNKDGNRVGVFKAIKN